jgi:hypothetical protein
LRIQICSNHGPLSLEGTTVYIGKTSFKIFSRTSRAILIKLETNHPWVKGIQVCSNKGPGPSQREDTCNHKNAKMGWGHLKVFSRTMGTEKVQIYLKAYWQCGIKFIEMDQDGP